jgi:hypothetical protein
MTELHQRERPPARPSDEATAGQLRIARKQGQAIRRAINTMNAQDQHGKE